MDAITIVAISSIRVNPWENLVIIKNADILSAFYYYTMFNSNVLSTRT